MKRIGKLHVLTDVVLQSRFSHSELAAMAISGGADTIQFRQKSGSTREMIEACKEIKAICFKAGVTFIVNDRVDVALAVEADGVHLGQDDFPPSLARELLGKDCIIGGSAGDMCEAMKCLSDGVDYIGFGPVYTTTSKDDAGPACGINTMKEIFKKVHLPVIAIGGIDVGNVDEVMGAGANGIAVISSVCCQEDPALATRLLYEKVYKDKAMRND